MLYETILMLNAFILAYSAVRIRRTIRSLNNAFPNENLIKVHIVNSFIYAFLFIFLFIMVVAKGKAVNQFLADVRSHEKMLHLYKVLYYFWLAFILI